MPVSVVIPTFNSAPLVVEAVGSVLAQTRPADEVVVVDDGSTDDTAARVAAFGDRVKYVRQPNARVAAARNTGLRHATGDVVAFLDADDAWHPQKLDRQLAVLAARPEIGLLATGLTAWPGPFPPLVGDPIPNVAAVPLDRMLLTNPIATSSVVVRRSVLDRVGPFDTELFGPEDYDLWLRAAQASGVGVLREPLTGYRDTPGSLGKQADTMRRGLLRIHAKLDAAGAWGGRRWFRRKCRSHMDYTTAYMYHAGDRRWRAAALLVKSLARYPVPMWPPDVRFTFARLRLLFAALRPRRGGAK